MKKLRLFFGVWIICCLGLITFSCNTTGVSPTNYSRLQVVNTIAGSLSLDCALNYTTINKTTIAFPNSTGYISTIPGSKYVGIRPTSTPTAAFLDTTTVVLQTNNSYSLFFTGQVGAYKTIFIQDSLSTPAIGRAKVRFVNASLNPTNLDITINAVNGFDSIAYRGIGKFIEVPAGTYEFKAYPTGTRTSNLATLSNQLLADGKVYTLYAQGLPGNTAANAAFGLSLITNLLPNTK